MFTGVAAWLAAQSAKKIAFKVLPYIWKPVLALVIVGGAYLYGSHTGGQKARAACKEEALKAQIYEIQRQKAETVAVLNKAQKNADASATEVEKLNEEVQAYVAQLQKNDACILGDDDARRLQLIR